MISDEIMRELRHIEKEIEILKIFEVPKASSGWVWLGKAGGPAQLTSTSWDGDAHSTTAKTLIDLSTVFGAPAGIKAISVYWAWMDSGSAGTNCFLLLSPNNNANEGIFVGAFGQANDKRLFGHAIIPCDANGDIYFQIVASGAGTMDVFLEIWGYELP